MTCRGIRPASRREPRLGLVASSLCLLLVAGCSSDSPGPPVADERLRFIVEHPEESLDPDGAFELETVLDLPVGSSGEVAPWRAGATSDPVADGLLTLGAFESATVPFGLPAESVDVVRLSVELKQRGTVELFWADDDGRSSIDHRVKFTLDRSFDGPYISFGVASHPLWKGRPQVLGVRYVSIERDKLRVSGLQGLRRLPDPAATSSLQARAFRMELDHEVRSAVLAHPDHPVVWALEVPEASTLRVGFGTESSASRPTDFRIALREESGKEAKNGAEVLFERRLGPKGSSDAGTWHRTTVDLAPWAGRRVELRLEVERSPEDRSLAFWSNPAIRLPGSGPPNILLVSLDTLRADHLPMYGYPRNTAPHLARWAESAVVFENAMATSPWTLPSHVSMFTGFDGLDHGVNYAAAAPQELFTLAEMLRAQGYATAAVTGGGFLDPRYGLAQGFDSYSYWPERGSDAEMQATVEKSLRWLEGSAGGPWFLFLHTYEVHFPFAVRSPFFENLSGREEVPDFSIGYVSEPEIEETGYVTAKTFVRRDSDSRETPLPAEKLPLLKDLYDSGIAYADSQLQRIWDHLAASGADEHTVVLVTSDHGEALGEKGLAGHAYNYDFNLHVPWILRLPGGKHGGRRVEQQVSLADVVPTLLDVAGLPAFPDLAGVSRKPALEGEAQRDRNLAWSNAAAFNRGVGLRVDNRWKLIYHRSPWLPVEHRQELFDLQADPGETRNLAEGDPPAAELEGLRGLVESRLAQRKAGTRIVLRNASAEPFRGEMRGSEINKLQTKGDLEARSEWLTGGVRENLSFDVPPGKHLELFLESLVDPYVHFFLRHGDGTPFEAAANEAKLATPWAIRFDGERWRAGTLDEGQAGQEIRIEWLGRVALGADPRSSDPELRKQLEALGYVQ